MSVGRVAARKLLSRMRVPVIGAPLFIVSNPALVIEQCKAGIVGSFPALNARPQAKLEDWLLEITEALATHDAAHPEAPAAPFAVNHIVHRSNDRLEADLKTCQKFGVEVNITSLGARPDVNDMIHEWGGMVMHDITTDFFAKKAISKGADGLIAVATGAGGHAGTTSPFSLVQDIRQWFDGPLALSGAISTGCNVLAAQVMGSDVAYIGSPFIATEEANADASYKQSVADCDASDIVYSNLFTGVHGNYLRPSIEAAGLDPDNLPEGSLADMNFDSKEGLKTGSDTKAWRDIWGCGSGIGPVGKVQPAGQYIAGLGEEYAAAVAKVVAQ